MVKTAPAKITSVVEANLAPAGTKIHELKQKLRGQVENLVKPCIGKLLKPIVEPVADALVDPVIKTYVKLLDLWRTRMTEVTDISTAHELAKHSWYWFQMSEVFNQIWKFSRGDAMQTLQQLLHGYSAWRFEDEFQDATTDLLRRACFTFEAEVKKTEKIAALKQVTEWFVHDCEISAFEKVSEIFRAIVMEPFNQEILPLVKDLIEPLVSSIPAPLDEIIDLNAILESIITETVKEALDGVLRPIFGPRIEKKIA